MTSRDGDADGDSDGNSGEAEQRRQAAERRRRRERVFGAVLPDVTGDEQADGADRAAESGAADPNEDWLRRQVPPHHG